MARRRPHFDLTSPPPHYLEVPKEDLEQVVIRRSETVSHTLYRWKGRPAFAWPDGRFYISPDHLSRPAWYDAYGVEWIKNLMEHEDAETDRSL